MLKISVICLAIAAAVRVDYTVIAKTRGESRAVGAQSQKKPPKLGYPDLFIPPTKGNGF